VGWLVVGSRARIDVVRVAQGFIYADTEPEQPVAADGYFAFIGLAVGVVITVLVWFALRRHRGVLMMIALALGRWWAPGWPGGWACASAPTSSRRSRARSRSGAPARPAGRYA
jgi:hypothetical protein